MDFTRIMLNHSLKVEGFRASNLLQLVVSKFAVGSLCYLHLKTLKRNPVVVIEVLKSIDELVILECRCKWGGKIAYSIKALLGCEITKYLCCAI